MENQQLQRARAALLEEGCDFALLSSLSNVTYTSGYEVPIPVGAGAELAFGSPCALVGTCGEGWLLAPDSLGARAQNGLDDFVAFLTFDSFTPVDARASFVEAVRHALHAAGLSNSAAIVGVEGRTLPHELSELLRAEFPQLRLVEIEGAFQRARMIKTEREIALLRHAASVGDIGHTTLTRLVKNAGQDEFEMWSHIYTAMNRAAGSPITLTGELVTGPRASVVAYPNGPQARQTQAGDAALMDISGRVNGYWFDCTNTHVIGAVPPTPLQKKLARASQDACEAAMNALHPGVLARDVAAAASDAFTKHGLPTAHYSGHGIGVSVNELPRLVPFDDTPIEAGMVFSVEPGAYEGEGGTFGARSEKMVLVTFSGPEILSQFAWGISE